MPQSRLVSDEHGEKAFTSVDAAAATDTGTQTDSGEVGKLGTFGRALGSSSLGAFMPHKPQPKSESAGSSVGPATAGVLLESQTSIDHFSTSPADLSSFDVPAGYKQVRSLMAKK